MTHKLTSLGRTAMPNAHAGRKENPVTLDYFQCQLSKVGS